jgi:hypothetical protein
VSKFVDPTYINRMDADQLRRELVIVLEQRIALSEALLELPEVPPVEALMALAHAGMNTHNPDTSAIGKALQRKVGLEAIPPKTEYEAAAGLWSIIRAALIAAKQQK